MRLAHTYIEHVLKIEFIKFTGVMIFTVIWPQQRWNALLCTNHSLRTKFAGWLLFPLQQKSRICCRRARYCFAKCCSSWWRFKSWEMLGSKSCALEASSMSTYSSFTRGTQAFVALNREERSLSLVAFCVTGIGAVRARPERLTASSATFWS